jgi:hypothetical protein
MDSDQRYSSMMHASSEAHNQWGRIQWRVQHESTIGFPTPHFQNISFWDLKSGTDNGITIGPRNRTDIVSTFEGRPQIGLVHDNETAFHVYWQENTFSSGSRTTNST